jgi:FkbM family methyltransferase
MKILLDLPHAGYLKHFEGALGILCDEGHSVHLCFHDDSKFDIGKATQEFVAAHPDVKISPAPRRADKWSGLVSRIRAQRNYMMYFDTRYAGKDRLRAAAAAEVSARDRAWVRRLVAMPGARPAFDRLLYLVERAVPSDPGIDTFVARIDPDVLLVSPLVWFNSPQVDYLKTARSLGIPSALCVASWDNLTNKGQMRELPDRVTVWNAAQVEEAVTLHRYPRDRVVVTGAQTFDQWCELRPSRSKQAFLSERGLAPDTRLLLYLCSSKSLAPEEARLVRQWQEVVRNAADPTVARAAILVRPHPNNEQPWQQLDSLEGTNFAVWPRDASRLFEPQWRHDHFDSMYHADAVIGLNTSAMIEAGLVGKPVLTVVSRDIPETIQATRETLHFDHLLQVNGGLLHVATSWEEHVQHLAKALDGDPAMVERSRRFSAAFVRPHGLERPAAPILADAIRSLPAVTRRDSWAERILCGVVLRSILEAAMTVRRIAPRRKAPKEARSKYPRLITLGTADKAYLFSCQSKKEVRRVSRLFTKEPGTIAWLSGTLRPGDVFFDIGANVGVYSIFAARELMLGGTVYAFEPHIANAAALLQNVQVNGLLHKVHVVSAPLSDRDGFAPFHYHSIDSSQSRSQFGPPVSDGQTFEPAATELKYGCRLDALVDSGALPAPTVVKIDVDGREAEIVAGMRSLLTSPRAPRSVQIELSHDNAERVLQEMLAAGYEVVSRHWTQAGQMSIDEGVAPLKQFPHNVVFAKATVSAPARPAVMTPARAG